MNTCKLISDTTIHDHSGSGAVALSSVPKVVVPQIAEKRLKTV